MELMHVESYGDIVITQVDILCSDGSAHGCEESGTQGMVRCHVNGQSILDIEV